MGNQVIEAGATGMQLSPPTSSGQPLTIDETVDKLLGVMVGWYGAKFSEQWAGVDRQVMRKMWVRGLKGFSREEIARGVDACRATQKWPPTLPEFCQLCRPPINYERAYLEALEQSAIREAGGRDAWSSPAVFWAIGEMGWDIRGASYRTLEARWKYALDKAMDGVASGRLGAVPEKQKALEYTERPAAPMPDNVRAVFARILGQYGKAVKP